MQHNHCRPTRSGRCGPPTARNVWVIACALLASLTTVSSAVSVLVPGDVAVTGFNGKGNDNFAFVCLVPLDAGVQLKFDVESAGDITWTVPAGGVAAGTTVVVTNPKDGDTPTSTSVGGTLTKANYNFESAGDALIVYQGATAIFAIETKATAYTPPAGISYADNTVAALQTGASVLNGYYSAGSPHTGVRGQILAAICTAGNWTYSAADPGPVFNAAPYNTGFTISPGTYWSSPVLDGVMFTTPFGTFTKLSTNTNRLANIRTDLNDALSNPTPCYANPGDSLSTSRRWFSVYFTNTVPVGASLTSVKLHIQHQGLAGKSGNFQILISTDKSQSGWYTNGTGSATFTSADIPWTSNEVETVYEAAAVLDTDQKLNNAEFLILNRAASTGQMNFDYITIEAIYQASGQPQVNNEAGASPVLPDSATLNGELTQGSPNPRVLMAWGDNIGGTSTSQWDRVEDLGTIGVGAFARTVNGLLANKTYYYRCYASNSLGEAWAPTNAVFTTTPPVIQFTPTATTQAEATVTLTLNITLNATSAVPVTVTVSPNGGTATAGTDYLFAITNITIPAGRTSTNVTLRLLDDGLNESTETAVLSLSAPVNAVLNDNDSYTLTITDNDALPGLSFANVPYSASEGAASTELTVRLSPASGSSVAVQYQTQNGLALAGSDYIATNGTLNFPPGATQAVLTVALVSDDTPEPVEQFFVNLFSPENAVVTGTNPVAVSIIDDDLSPPRLNNDLGAVPVSSNAATLNGTLESAGGYVTYVRTYYGLADGGTNPAAWANNLFLGTLSQGAFSNRVTGLSTNTAYYYRCAASNQLGLVWATNTVSFFTGPPTVRFTAGSSTNLESVTPMLFPIALSAPPVYGDDVTVSCRRSAGSATEGSDFTFATTTVVIRAGMSSTNFTAYIVNDALDENNERFDIAITSVANARLGAPSALSYVIEDEDPLPLLSFVGSPYSVSESGTSITVRVNLSPVSGRFVDVNYATVDASAIAGDDYLKATGRLTWSAGDSSTRSITIPILNDSVSQGDRYFVFQLSNPGFAAFATSDRESIVILEDDALPPQVSNASGATDVRGSMAQLNGKVLAGIPYPQVRVYWGTSNGGTTPAAWGRTNLIGQQAAEFSTEVRGLLPTTTYYYRCFASNAAGSDWADATASFQTTAGKDYFVNDRNVTNDVYCSALGTNANSGLSSATPKEDIQAVIDAYDLNPGDTVFIDTGLYVLPDTLILDAADTGSAGLSADVMFRGSPHADGTILDRADIFSDVINVAWAGSTEAYLTFAKLQITGGRRGIRVLGDSSTPTRGLKVSQCVVHDTYAGSDGAVSLQFCDDARIENSTIYNNDNGIYLRDCSAPSIVSNLVFSHTFSGIRVRNSSAPTIAYNTAYGQNDGILVSTGIGGEQVLFNASYSNANNGISVTGDAGLIRGNRVFANDNDGINLDGGGFEVSGNTVYGNGAEGLDTSGDGGLVCINNLVYLNTNVNVNFYGANSVIRFEHNTLYGGNGIYWAAPWAVTNRHNIIWTTDPGHVGIDVPNIPAGDGVMVSDRNCLYATTAASAGRWGSTACSSLQDWQSVSWKDPNSLGVDPLFADSTRGDFHLQSRAGSYHGGLWNVDAANSPCIDAGDPTASFTNEPAYNGLMANLGAFGNTAEASKTHYTGAFYSLTLARSPVEAGSVHMAPVSALYPTNRPITIWAVVTNDVYSWFGWGGSYESEFLTNTLYVTTNMTITAYFDAGTNYTGPMFTVTLAALPVEAGAVYISPVQPTYPTNQLVTIWATVTNSAYTWQSWTGSLQTVTVTNSFYVLTNMSMTARFNALTTNTNGVPGWWLAGYGLPNNQAGADADSDLDGLENWKEYYAGTVPTNRASVLTLSAAARTVSLRDALTFQAVTGKLYRVQLSSNLPSRLWTYWPVALTTNGAPTVSPIAGTGTVMTLYATPPAGVRPFYRVDLNYTP
ncbi:MAG: right-handed parallel beta-helix repeat-containing protein [Lentisphaerae bacterium]|nr:right-handed parallel beta-helix repeat-containing protein [Lentisphaerota bacterium]